MTDQILEIIEDKLERIQEKNMRMDGFTLALHLTDMEDGDYILDGYQNPPTIEKRKMDAECALSLTSGVMLDILNKKTQPMLAFSLGKIKLKGDMSVAMNLMQIIKG